MSVETMAIVLHHSRATGTAKLILLGIANHSGDGGAWPKVSTLASYANVDRTSVQRSLRKLQKLGELHIDQQRGGPLRMRDIDRPNRYEVLVKCPPDCDRSAQHRTPEHRVIHKSTGTEDGGGAGAAPTEVGAALVQPPGGGTGAALTISNPLSNGSRTVTGGRPASGNKHCEICNHKWAGHTHLNEISGDDHPFITDTRLELA